MSINVVLLDGEVQHAALRYGADGKPEYRFTVAQQEHLADGRTIPFYWPCCALGAASERLASEIEDGQHIVITSGKLCYRKRQTKQGGEQSRMEILVWSAERLTTSAQVEPSSEGEGDSSSKAPVSAPEPKKGRPRYPKWKAPAASQN